MAINNQLNIATVPIPVFTTTVTLSSANIQAMNIAGILLIPAQGANTCIMVHDVFNEYIFNTTTYINGDAPQLQYGITNADFNPTPIFLYSNNLFTNVDSIFYATNGSDTGGALPVATTVINSGVYISNYTAPYSGGDSTAKITLFYSVITTTA